MLGQHVSGIVSSSHLAELEISSFETVLNPEIRHMEVPNLSKAAATANAYRSGSISEYLNAEFDTQV